MEVTFSTSFHPEDAVLVAGCWSDAVFGNIKLDKLNGFGLQFY